MEKPTIKDLLEAGVHFGHQTKRWNPKMEKYIFTEKNGIHIIDLSQTLTKLDEALDFLTKVVSVNPNVLLVGTKRQAQEIVKDIAENNNLSYVTNRWVGGLLTNFSITKKNVKNMIELEKGITEGIENRTKQEISLMSKELERLQRLYGGIKKLSDRPSVIILADPHNERIAIKEAKRLRIPIIAIVDTNCDPDEVDYLVPGNDDAISSITLFFNIFASTIKNAVNAKVEKKEDKVNDSKPIKKVAKKITQKKK